MVSGCGCGRLAKPKPPEMQTRHEGRVTGGLNSVYPLVVLDTMERRSKALDTMSQDLADCAERIARGNAAVLKMWALWALTVAVGGLALWLK
jgi:hypothetical protein